MEQDKVKTADQSSEKIPSTETTETRMPETNQGTAKTADQSSGETPSTETAGKEMTPGNPDKMKTADQILGGISSTGTAGKEIPQANQDPAKTADQGSGGTPSVDTTRKEMPQGNPDKAKTEGQSSGAPSSADTIPQPQGTETKMTTAKPNKEEADKILEVLNSADAIVLTGSPGAGKTWLAKQITKSAVSKDGHFYMSLWLSLSLKEKQDDGLSLLQSIARQLSVPYVGSAWEDAVYNTDSTKEEKKEVLAEDPWKLGRDVVVKLARKFVEMKKKAEKEKNETKHTFLLLVLDSEEEVKIDELLPLKNLIYHLLPLVSWENLIYRVLPHFGSQGSEKKPSWKNIIGPLLPLDSKKKDSIAEALEKPESNIKVLITSTGGEFNSSDSIREIKVEPFSEEDAVDFLTKRVGNVKLPDSDFQTLCEAINAHCRDKTKVLPAQLIMLAEALKHIEKKGTEEQVRAFDAALKLLKDAKATDAMPLLSFVYETLIDGSLIVFFWHSFNLLGKYGGVQYNELIAHWILEGHLDLADGIKKAYEKGYDIMMKLVDFGMLKMQEDNLIVLERATRTLEDHDCRELLEKSNLGLGGLLKGNDSKVFERMAPTDGMMRSVSVVDKKEEMEATDGKMRTMSVDKKLESVSSLLIDGSSLCREDPDTFFRAEDHFKVLALFDPRMKSLPEPISRMKRLLLLVLRGCSLLDSVNCIKSLEELVVLEISGSPCLAEMDDDLLEKMTKLKSLNLSELGITSLPLVHTLKELRRLILRKCRFLEALPKLANLKQIEVIDLSGSSSLKKLQEKSFKSFKELRFADFSGTKIEKLPIVQTLPNLSVLLVKGCDNLAGLRFMKHLPKLKVLDVSGATRIKEIFYDCFDDTENLRFLDLSETDIRFLPDSLGKHLCGLKLKGCSKLEKLLSSTGLTNLESLDLSDSSGLQKFPDDFFVNLTSLRSLDLSNSKVKYFPSLPNLHNLRYLRLKGCSFERPPESKTFGSFEGLTNLVELDLSDCKSQAEQLPSLEGLNLLEVIKLSGYKALSEIGSLKHMSVLQELDLSETQISTLPDLSPTKLRYIILNKCTLLKEAPDFKIPPLLEELDVRGTSFLNLKGIDFEALSRLPQLRKLRLSKTAFDCIQSYLDNLKQLEVLDLSGETVESLPSSLASLTNLRQLLLKGCSSLKELPSLNSLSKLEVIDLSGTKVENVGDKISQLRNLKNLHLPEEVAEEFKDGKNVDAIPIELKLDHCCISESSEIPQGEKKPRIVLQGAEVLKSLKENSTLLESIRHSSSYVRAQSKDEDNYSDSRKHIFGDIYAKIRKLPSEAKDGQSLEIHGFDAFPDGIEVLLEHAKYVFLVENGFMKNLSDLKPDSLKNISGCWLERCNNMECMVVQADQGKWRTLEILWISNLPKLKSLYDEVQSLSFGSIKCLYIDCCPMLESVFPSGIPENLETLEITFCDNLKRLVGDKGPDDKKVQTPDSTTQKDKEPETEISKNKKEPSTSAGKEAPARTKSSAPKQVHGMSSEDKGKKEPNTSSGKEAPARTKSSAPKQVQEMSSEDKGKEGEELAANSEDEGKGPDGASSIDKGKDKEAETHTASFADDEGKGPESSSSVDKGKKDKEVETQASSSVDKGKGVEAHAKGPKDASPVDKGEKDKEEEPTRSGTNLKHLRISCCPMLETVLSSQQVPEKLETLQIKRCDKLKSVFSSELNNPELPNLQTLHLSDLPIWTSSEFGFRFNKFCNKIIEIDAIKGGQTKRFDHLKDGHNESLVFHYLAIQS
ncbi:hypothetical protein V6N13_138311 [Hibiscus sabdariffa]|uniref:NB-ARC domain-containing protein n=1 Tax=Hibiscus sabdariffa TaxID=183260 RepID=A0ABR2QD33_9ROSI